MNFNIMQFSPNPYYFPLLDPSIFPGSLFNKKENLSVGYIYKLLKTFFVPVVVCSHIQQTRN
jgi:hypothetical protein